MQETLGLGTADKPLLPCSEDQCSEWCRQEYGRSVASTKFGCQHVSGAETLAFCECSDGGRTDADVTQVVLCHEPLVCSVCEHGYCSTSPVTNELYNNFCVVCEPGFVRLPTGVCVLPGAIAMDWIYSCPADDPCLKLGGGVCVNGDSNSLTPFYCECRQGYEGPLCQAGTQQRIFS